MRQILFRRRFAHLVQVGTQISVIKGYRNPLKVNEQFIPVTWSGLPYFRSQRVVIREPLTVRTVMDFRKTDTSIILNGVGIYGRPLDIVALNCGFTSVVDLLEFFPFEYSGQIYIWGAENETDLLYATDTANK